ncbi:peptidylprolyl isomerase [Caenimonas terrae]|uniref:peptidylprolyl isomerase n=1 Tax=Caenimonas terrae TaxID=696074 RepID=A0ABW0NKG2_9BURK
MLAALASFASAQVLAADAVLAETKDAKITTMDIKGDALRFPVEVQKANLSKPENVLQIANNLVIRRQLALNAEAAGIAKDPAVMAALHIARDKVLSDALIAKIDAAAKPKPETVERLALANYKANPERFRAPAETTARHILIKMETPDAKAKAEAILAQLKAGADFASLAREKSEDPGSAVNGGSVGSFPKNTMVAPFEKALDKLEKPGDMSGVVETQFGYHIIKLEGRRPAGIRPYDEVKAALQREVETKILSDARVAEVQKVQDLVKVDKDAISAFAASNSK